MSLWGGQKIAPNVYIYFYDIFIALNLEFLFLPLRGYEQMGDIFEECLLSTYHDLYASLIFSNLNNSKAKVIPLDFADAKPKAKGAKSNLFAITKQPSPMASGRRYKESQNLQLLVASHSLYSYFSSLCKGTTLASLKEAAAPTREARYNTNKKEEGRGIKFKNIEKRVRAESRIGPHNKTIISIIFGGLLGDGFAEYRSKGNGTRIRFYQEGSHLSYLLYLHKKLADLEYCNPTTPKLQTRLGKKGVVRKIIRFNSWTYSSFNWIQELWYVDGVKAVPKNIGEYLDPLALAI